MLDKHIPEIHATGCFAAIEFCELDATHFKTVYTAASQAALDRYLAHHQAAFKADFVAHFPAGATPSRAVWRLVRRWA